MDQFYKVIKKEVNTEKSQKHLTENNLRTFITLPIVTKNSLESLFVKSFGFKPEKINSLTFTKVINNKKTRTSRRVKMKKFFILLPQGKELNHIKN
jgi:ribosomal protein L23